MTTAFNLFFSLLLVRYRVMIGTQYYNNDVIGNFLEEINSNPY